MLRERRKLYGKSTMLVPIPLHKNVPGFSKNENCIQPQALKHCNATNTDTHVATVKAQLT